MGSFRSKPDLTKHSISKETTNFSYTVVNMCGSIYFTQVGDFSCKMHISQQSSAIKKHTSLVYLMDTAV